MTALAAHLGLPLSTATHRVDRLVKKRICVRKRSAADRRVVEVSLTPKGRQMFEFFSLVRQTMVRDMLAPLSPAERQQLLRLMTKVRDKAAASPLPLPPFAL